MIFRMKPVALACLAAFTMANSAFAQQSSVDARIAALQQQIEALKAEIESLKRETGVEQHVGDGASDSGFRRI